MKHCALLLLLLVVTILVASSYQASNSTIKVSRHYPEDVTNVKGWGGYIIYFILVLLFPLLAILALYLTTSIIYCARCCCQCCGGSRSRADGYSKTSVTWHKIMFFIFYTVVVIMLVIAIIFTILFSATIKKVQRDTVTALDTVNNRVDKALNIVNILSDRVNDTFSKTDGVFSAIDGFSTGLTTIGEAITSSIADLGNMTAVLSEIDTQLETLKDQLTSISQETSIEGAPTPDEVPTTQSSVEFLNRAENALQSVRDRVDTTRTEIDDLKANVITRVQDLKDDILSTAGTLSGEAGGPLNQTKTTKQTFDKYYKIGKRVVNAVDGVRLAIFLLIYVVVIALFSVGCVGTIVGWKWTVKCSICIAFFVTIIFLLIALIQLFLLVGLTDLCREAEPAVRRSQSVVDRLTGSNSNSARSLSLEDMLPARPQSRKLKTTYIQNALTATTIDTSQLTNVSFLMDNILYCSGNGSLLELIPGFSLDSFNLSSYTDVFDSTINQVISEFNISAITSQAASNVDLFRGFSGLINSRNITDSIAEIQGELNFLYGQLSNLTAFGFAEDQANALLNDLNTNSAAIGGDYFSLDNVTLLDPNSPPYNTDTTYYDNTRQTLLEYKDQRDEAITHANNVQNFAISANYTIQNITYQIELLQGLVDDTYAQADKAKGAIRSLDQVFQDVISAIYDVIAFAKASLAGMVDDVLGLAGCAFIGNFYGSSKQHLCKEMPPYSGMISLDCFLLCIWLLVWFVLLLPVTKRVGNNRKVENDYDAQEMRTM